MTFLLACGGATCAADMGVLGAVGGISIVGVLGFWLFGKATMRRSSRRMDALAAEDRRKPTT